jgi:hypothetical protein
VKCHALQSRYSRGFLCPNLASNASGWGFLFLSCRKSCPLCPKRDQSLFPLPLGFCGPHRAPASPSVSAPHPPVPRPCLCVDTIAACVPRLWAHPSPLHLRLCPLPSVSTSPAPASLTPCPLRHHCRAFTLRQCWRPCAGIDGGWPLCAVLRPLPFSAAAPINAPFPCALHLRPSPLHVRLHSPHCSTPLPPASARVPALPPSHLLCPKRERSSGWVRSLYFLLVCVYINNINTFKCKKKLIFQREGRASAWHPS